MFSTRINIVFLCELVYLLALSVFIPNLFQPMQIIITGGAGFLGQRLAKALLNSSLVFEELLLVDLILPTNPGNDGRVRCQQGRHPGHGEP